MEKLFEEKIASGNKILATKNENELLITNRVTAPLGTDLSAWLEFNTEDEAYAYFGVEKGEENAN